MEIDSQVTSSKMMATEQYFSDMIKVNKPIKPSTKKQYITNFREYIVLNWTEDELLSNKEYIIQLYIKIFGDIDNYLLTRQPHWKKSWYKIKTYEEIHMIQRRNTHRDEAVLRFKKIIKTKALSSIGSDELEYETLQYWRDDNEDYETVQYWRDDKEEYGMFLLDGSYLPSDDIPLPLPLNYTL
jgi:hypothetical protein